MELDRCREAISAIEDSDPGSWKATLSALLSAGFTEAQLQFEFAAGPGTFSRWLDGSAAPREMSRRLLRKGALEMVGQAAGRDPAPEEAPKRTKFNHVGAPECFALTQCCQQLNDAFGGHGCYQVGSSLDRPDWRDVDVRFILDDAEFNALFPDAGRNWEHDPRWLLLTVSIAAWLSKQTGLPIDFQFQPRTHANEHHKGARNALGLRFAKQST